MRLLVILLLLAGCSTPQRKVQSRIAFSQAAPKAQLALRWDYSLAPNISFEIYSATAIQTNWTPYAETATNFLPLSLDSQERFFIVRARDNATGLVSDWNK